MVAQGFGALPRKRLRLSAEILAPACSSPATVDIWGNEPGERDALLLRSLNKSTKEWKEGKGRRGKEKKKGEEREGETGGEGRRGED